MCVPKHGILYCRLPFVVSCCCVMLHNDDTGVQEINKTKKKIVPLPFCWFARAFSNRPVLILLFSPRGIFLFDFCGVFSAPEYSHTHTHGWERARTWTNDYKFVLCNLFVAVTCDIVTVRKRLLRINWLRCDTEHTHHAYVYQSLLVLRNRNVRTALTYGRVLLAVPTSTTK